MELCQLKLYGRIIDLEVGDMFWTNGSFFAYEPKGKNINLIPRGGDVWHRASSCSCAKYEKEVRLADNLKLITNNVGLKTWVVQYVYKQDRPQYEALIVMMIDTEGFKVLEAEVEKETKALIFFKGNHPITYHSKFDKVRLLIPQDDQWGRHSQITCRIDDYGTAQDTLFAYHEKKLQGVISLARQKLISNQKEFKQFIELKYKQGYNEK